MSIIVFIFLGLIAGYIARGLFKGTGNGVVLNLALGVAGAVIVGSLFSHIAATGSAGLNTGSALVAALAGAAALLATFHGLRDTRYRRGDLIGSSKPSFKPGGVAFYVSRQNAHHTFLHCRADDHPWLRVHAHA